MKRAREYGVRVLWNFLVGSPGESIEWYDELIESMPWAIHLNPLQGIRLISYHQQPDRYGLNLVPDRAYSHIYPLSPDLLNDLAYLFEDTHRQVRHGTPPEYQQLEELTNQWRESFKLPQPPMLSLIDQGDCPRIVDTRPCAVEAEMILSGLAYKVYQVCDRHLSQTELLNALKRKHQLEVSWEEVEPVVQELRDRRILLSIGDRYLSLAVREPIHPLMAERDYPSGSVDVESYVRDRTEQLQNSLKQKLLASVAT